MATFTSTYPPAFNNTYVKATTEYDADRAAYYAADNTKSLTANYYNNAWLANAATNQRFHIDLGSAKCIRRIYLENFIEGGASTAYTNSGVKNFTFWGTNDAAAFAELTYATDTNWTQITTSASLWAAHITTVVSDPQYLTASNTNTFRYYSIKFADAQVASPTLGPMGVRRIELQTEDGYVPPAANFFMFL